MKNLFTNILKTFAIFAVFFGTAAFADAASFDPNPSPANIGITSIIESGPGQTCVDCGGQETSVSLDINNPGDVGYVTVFTDFMALRNSSEDVINARGIYFTDNDSDNDPSYTFTTKLNAQNANPITDSVTVNGLPDSYDIEFVDGEIQNEHGGTVQQGVTCPAAYDYNVNTNNNLFSSGGQYLGDLSTMGGSWCAQGSIAVKYKITNTEVVIDPNPDPEVQTNGATNVDEDSARLNGEVIEGDNEQVWFALTTGTTPSCSSSSQRVNVSGSYDAGQNFSVTKTGLQEDTTYRYRACINDGINGSVRTFTTDDDVVIVDPGDFIVRTDNPTNIDQDSARLNGTLVDGTAQSLFFVFGTSSSDANCNTGAPIFYYDGQAPFNAPYSFDNLRGGLAADQTYYYRACAQEIGYSGQIASGGLESFTTDDDGGQTGGDDEEPNAETLNEDDVDENSAELNGRIEMNDFNNGIVFYAYGQDESMVEDTESYDSYDTAANNEDGDDYMVERVDDDNDDDSWVSYPETVSGLDEDETYYYRICVEYDDNGDTLECGDVEQFSTDEDDDDDGNNNDDLEIITLAPRNITQTTAEMCADLIEDGGDSVETYIQFRRSNGGSYTETPARDRREGQFCTRVTGLTPNTTYVYRGCAEDECGSTRNFRTQGTTIPVGQSPFILTDNPTNITSNSATLNGTYTANGGSGSCYFEYGRTSSLGSRTPSYNVTGVGVCTHSFTQLASSQNYCVRAVINTQYGTDRGSTKCFTTTSGPIVITQPPVVIVEEDDDIDIDLASLGLGLSLVRLEIDDSREVVTEGENVTYVIEWENISEIDLTDLDLKITIPSDMQVTSSSRGRIDADRNVVLYTIDDLDAGEDGEMTVSTVVVDGQVGKLFTAEATLAYDNPINDAQENALDFDTDEYGVRIAGQTASIFGLANITFLGWLVIILGLFIIFLVARWLYLEREELRAQAYANNYNPYATPGAPVQPVQPVAQQPYAPPQNYGNGAPQNGNGNYYEPYRPNRG